MKTITALLVALVTLVALPVRSASVSLTVDSTTGKVLAPLAFNQNWASNEFVYNPSMSWNVISNSLVTHRSNVIHTFMPGPYEIYAQHLWGTHGDQAPFLIRNVQNYTLRGRPFAEFRVIGSLNPTGQLFTPNVTEPSFNGVVMNIKDYKNVTLENFRLIAWNKLMDRPKTNIHGPTENTVPAWITVAGTNSQNFVMNGVTMDGFPNQGIYHSSQVQGSSLIDHNTRQTNNFIYRCTFRNGGSTNVGPTAGLDGTAISSVDNTIIDSCIFENNFRDLEPYRDALAFGAPNFFSTRWWVNKCQFYNTLPNGYVLFPIAPRVDLRFTDNLVKVDRDANTEWSLGGCAWASLPANMGGRFVFANNQIIGFRTCLIEGAPTGVNGNFAAIFSGNQFVSNRIAVWKSGTGGSLTFTNNQVIGTQVVNSMNTGGPSLLIDHTTELVIVGNIFRDGMRNQFWSDAHGHDITLYSFSSAGNTFSTTNVLIANNVFTRTNWVGAASGLQNVVAPIGIGGGTERFNNANFLITGNAYVGYRCELIDDYAGRAGSAGSTVRHYTNPPALLEFKTNAASPASLQMSVSVSGGANLRLVIAKRDGYGVWKTHTAGQVGFSGADLQQSMLSARLPSRAVWWLTNDSNVGTVGITNMTLTWD